MGIGNDWRYLVVEQKHKEHLFNKKDFIEFLKQRKSYTLLFCKRENEIFLNSFTAEKQIELIKLLMNAGCFTGYAYKTEVKKYMLSYKLKSYYNEDFGEALAGLALQLIEAGELGKDEVRRILE